MLRKHSDSVPAESGTASIEMIATLPFLLLAVMVAAQLGLVGQALWSAGIAARAGARTALVGGSAPKAARRALPPSMRQGSVVREKEGVAVRVAVPRLLPLLPRIRVGAHTDLGAGG
ncbi:MAG TPA: hypothetical protein VFZ41_07670 [Solirubrobacterales bacterium]